MKNKNISSIIVRKDLDKNEEKGKLKNKSIRIKVLAISVVCLVLTCVFAVFMVWGIRCFNRTVGLDRRIENAVQPGQNDKAIHIDFEEMYYVKDRGRRELSTYKVIETIITLMGVILFYGVLFFKMTNKMMDRISEICISLDNLASGEYGIIIDEGGNDELSRMSEDINLISRKFNAVLEEERTTEAAKNELITSIAHDLRTPITSIIGYLELITGRELDNDTRDKFLAISYDKSKRLESLIEDLFMYTKFSFGQYPLNYSNLNLGKLLEQLIDEFYPQLMEEQIEYTYKCHGNIMVDADGDLLARLFANLLGNSIKYGKDGKNIDIEADCEADMAVVSITNYGQVIPKEEVEKIFDKFYRLESSRSRNTGGTGLGLSIVRQIVELHNGTIEARSDENGTVFTVKLPLKCGMPQTGDKEQE